MSVHHANFIISISSFRLTMGRAKRMPTANVMSQYVGDGSLDRISRLSLQLQGLPDNVNSTLATDMLARELDTHMCIHTVMEAAVEVLRDVPAQNQDRNAAGTLG